MNALDGFLTFRSEARCKPTL